MHLGHKIFVYKIKCQLYENFNASKWYLYKIIGLSCLKTVAIIFEVNYNITLFIVSLDLPLNLSTNEVTMLTVDFCCKNYCSLS